MNFRKGGGTVRFLVASAKGREWKNLEKGSCELGRSRVIGIERQLGEPVGG